MTVAPEFESYYPGGLLSALPVPVTLDPDTGDFSMTLNPSGDLTPSSGGPVGVDYIIRVGRFEQSITGTSFVGVDAWRFSAAPGGGNVGSMSGGTLTAIWIGPPWPSPLAPGIYIDKDAPNAWGIYPWSFGS